MTRPAAFTLIELLVVVTIIVVLLAMLVPAMDRAIASAEAVVCGTRLRSMHQAFYWYQADYRNTWIAPWDLYNLQGTAGSPLPPTGSTVFGANLSWQWAWPYVMAFYAVPGKGKPPVPPALGPTLGSGGSASFMNPKAAAIMFCPTLLGQGRTWFQGSGWTTWSYGMIAPPYNLVGYPKVSRFTHPQDTVHLQDYAWLGTATSPGNASTNKKAETVPNAWSTYYSIATDPHLGKSNYAFCDGHVERLAHRWSEGENGAAIAAPPVDRNVSDLQQEAYHAY